MMEDEAQAVYKAILEAHEGKRPCAMATVVATRGSTPRKNGARMLIDPVRGLVGTVGGGCGEAEVIQAAREAIEEGLPRMVRVDLTDDPLSWSGSVCGGVLDIFIEPILPETR